MGFRHPVPNEQQSERLKIHGMDPSAYVVMHAEENGMMLLKHYKTGDEIRILPNPLKYAQQRV